MQDLASVRFIFKSIPENQTQYHENVEYLIINTLNIENKNPNKEIIFLFVCYRLMKR